MAGHRRYQHERLSSDKNVKSADFHRLSISIRVSCGLKFASLEESVGEVGSGRWADFERCSRIHACGWGVGVRGGWG